METKWGLAGSGTLENHLAPLDKVSRSRTNKMRLHDIKPRKRIKRRNTLDYDNFRNHYQNVPVQYLGFF